MRSISGYRLALGLLQGAALSLLYLAYEQHSWPATNGEVFAPLLMAAFFVPLMVTQSLRLLRPRTLAGWTIVATVLIAALSFYDIWHAWPQDWAYSITLPSEGAWQPHILPSWHFFVALAAILFIAHALIVSADTDRQIIARYTTYFDIAWEQGCQLGLAAAFVGAFWALMWLGAGLFELLKIDFLSRLFRHYWFWIPATTLAIAIALHVTDARVSLVRGTRVLALTLLSLLLPLLTLLILGFLGAIGVEGLEPLWSTRLGSSLLLFATAILVVLTNATYQDGAHDRPVAAPLRWAGTIAAILPVPLVALAAYALALRIGQYGWSADRIIATASVIIGASYALGYVGAAFVRPWLWPIERWNVYCAFATLLVLLALFSPIADPARLSVNDQIARVAKGTIPASKLDLTYLRWDAGRYGKAALEEIAARQGDGEKALRESVGRLLEAKYRYEQPQSARPLVSNFTIHADDGKLPDSFLTQDWRTTNDYSIPACLRTTANAHCDAFVKDLKSDGSPQIILVEGSIASGFDRDDSGTWHLAARWLSQCSDTTHALGKGDFAAAAPLPSPWPDLDVAGQRLHFAAPNPPASACPKS